MSENAWLDAPKTEASGDWVAWTPQENQNIYWPVGGECAVVARLRNGQECRTTADDLNWDNEASEGDIVAYQVIEWSIDDEEWFDAPGGFCPVPPETWVMIETGNGWMSEKKYRAFEYGWDQDREPSDQIVRYRIVGEP